MLSHGDDRLGDGEAVTLTLPDGTPSGLSVELFAVPGKVPLYLEMPPRRRRLSRAMTTVGAAVSDGTTAFVLHSGLRANDRCAGADGCKVPMLVLFDGTLWTDDEMLRAGIGGKTGLRMGHMSVSGPNGTLAAFADHRMSAQDPAAHQQLQPDPAG